ncbi:MAG: YbjQ family protein [Lachnospiraceae bacterium]|nr:YbjQ family protein [Lachnospiraceae bacterium]
MLIVTSETITGKNLEMLGVVKGSTIQTVNAIKDLGASLKTIVGGELSNYNEMMGKARDIATERMVAEAEKLGADAIVCMRYATSAIMQSAAEVMAYGTAVKFIS